MIYGNNDFSLINIFKTLGWITILFVLGIIVLNSLFYIVPVLGVLYLGWKGMNLLKSKIATFKAEKETVQVFETVKSDMVDFDEKVEIIDVDYEDID